MPDREDKERQGSPGLGDPPGPQSKVANPSVQPLEPSIKSKGRDIYVYIYITFPLFWGMRNLTRIIP